MKLADNIRNTYTTNEVLIGLAGNPNVGKSTVFNNLTGMNQHTGNWPGKTVSLAQGYIKNTDEKYRLVDLPGTYSLLTHSSEEDVARDFICFGGAEKTVIVCDATCLERNLNLCLQIIEITDNVVICVNLLDEANKKGIKVDLDKLSSILKVPVVGVIAHKYNTLEKLKDKIFESVSTKEKFVLKYPCVVEECIEVIEKSLSEYKSFPFSSRWLSINLLTDRKNISERINDCFSLDLLRDSKVNSALNEAEKIMERYGFSHEKLCDKIAYENIKAAEKISKECTVRIKPEKKNMIDKILTGKYTAFPIMLVMLLLIFWITIKGANYPSEILSELFSKGENIIYGFLINIGVSKMITEILVCGIYKITSWVVSVMLPPMAIFFPLFTLCEDVGLLPRIAFNLDNCFQKCNTCGKQALTICMGFGCNAVGVTGARIIDSERERLCAMLTNSFVPCNGRFPMIISVISLFFVSATAASGLISAAVLTAVICFSILMTLVVSKILSLTFLKGLPSSFSLELPPFRTPQFGKIIVRSVLDRTLFVLGRAVSVAAPAGLIIWLMTNIDIGEKSILLICADFLDPFATLLGLDGIILMSFVLGFPANEIVLPLTIMGYTAAENLQEVTDMQMISEVLHVNDWNYVTAICFVVFALMHWPCSTTCITIYKETKSIKWTVLGFLIPTLSGMTICFFINTLYKIITAIV